MFIFQIKIKECCAGGVSGTLGNYGRIKDKLLQFATHRAVIRVRGHDIRKYIPTNVGKHQYWQPAFQRFRFNLSRGKQQITRFVEVNGVVMRTRNFNTAASSGQMGLCRR